MTAFTESWLADHQRRQAQYRGGPVESVIAAPSSITFRLSEPTPSLNEVNRMRARHWSVYSKHQKRLAETVAAAISPAVLAIHRPYQRARLTIIRHGMRLLDADNLWGGVKGLQDLLLVRSATHPHSFGIVVDDDPAHLVLAVEQVRVLRRADRGTLVTVEEMEASA